MDQLPQTPVCIAVSVSDVVLRQAVDEDGAQRLISAVIGRGIGIGEELSARGILHGCAPGVRWFSASGSSPGRIKTRAPGQAGWCSGLKTRRMTRGAARIAATGVLPAGKGTHVVTTTMTTMKTRIADRV